MINNIKTIGNRIAVGTDHFRLLYLRKSNKYLKDYLDMFNIDDYIIYKATRTFKKVSTEEFLEFKHSGYLLIRKDYKHFTDEFIDWYKDLNIDLNILFLHKPIQFKDFNKIKIIDKK